jgi:hypothetical protein
MAWASKKQFAILNGSKEGKDIIERLPKLKQDEFQKVFDNYLNKPKGSKPKNEKAEAEKAAAKPEPQEEAKPSIGKPAVKDEPEKSPKKKEEQKDENPIDEKNREEKTGSDYKDYVSYCQEKKETPVTEEGFHSVVAFIEKQR